jgi:hypothetical protein
VPENIFTDKSCMSGALQIAHYRDNEGYVKNWYDAENMDRNYRTYAIPLPTKLSS